MADTQTEIKHRVDIRRTYVLQIRLRPLEHDEIFKKAEKMGITPAAYGRMAIKNYRRGA
ncbi:MAG: hypothetical protein V3T23_13485 [Nitrososphaerales archaeon]